MQLSLEEIGKVLEENWEHTSAAQLRQEMTKISTDTRTLAKGDIFLALKGENFDGHQFAREAAEKGAGALILEQSFKSSYSPPENPLPVLFVKDALQALGDVAAHWRKRFQIPVVGLTGSNGKTTTRAILGTLLGERYKVHQTGGNLNNLIGLPLAVLELDAKHEVAVFEMGMNRLGEIARLTEITQPTLGLITNVSGVHLEYLQTVERVAQAKGELFEGLPSGSYAAVNEDDYFCPKLAERAGIPAERRVTFGWQKAAAIQVERREALGDQGTRVWLADRRIEGNQRIFDLLLPLPGDHNVYNLLAAVACALFLGVEREHLRAGVAKIKPVGSRSRIQVLSGLSHLPGKISLIDDCYNANPTSMMAALNLLKQLAAADSGVAVLGEMLELGESRLNAHRELGQKAAAFGLNALFVVGESADEVASQAIQAGMKENQIRTFHAGKKGKPPDAVMQELYEDLKQFLSSDTWVLVKGSRGMALERLVALLNKG